MSGVVGDWRKKGEGSDRGGRRRGAWCARALGSATRRDTIRARERALSPEVLRRVSPRGILGYVRVVQELADNELARSAWCRRGSRFRGVSSFLFFFVRCVDTRALGRANERANERTSERRVVCTCCVCVCVCPTISLVRSPTVLPIVPSYVAGPVPTYDRRRRHRHRYRHPRLRHLRRLRRLDPK